MRGVEEVLAEFDARAGVARPVQPRWRRVAAVAVPLAAAASLALVLGPWRDELRRWRDEPVPLPLPVMKSAERTAAARVVVPAGRDAVLFRTSNPKVTVVWIY
jgi:hypothetical protein